MNSVFDTAKRNSARELCEFWGEIPEWAPRFRTALISKNTVYVSKTAHNVVKTWFELTGTNRSPTVRNGEFWRKLAPEMPRRTRRNILRGEFPAGSFFAQPSNWGGIRGKKKSAICRSHGADFRKNGGADGSWTHDLYDAKVHECATYQWDIKVLRNYSVIPASIVLKGGVCLLLLQGALCSRMCARETVGNVPSGRRKSNWAIDFPWSTFSWSLPAQSPDRFQLADIVFNVSFWNPDLFCYGSTG